jgi:hypothetical protein
MSCLRKRPWKQGHLWLLEHCHHSWLHNPSPQNLVFRGNIVSKKIRLLLHWIWITLQFFKIRTCNTVIVVIWGQSISFKKVPREYPFLFCSFHFSTPLWSVIHNLKSYSSESWLAAVLYSEESWLTAVLYNGEFFENCRFLDKFKLIWKNLGSLSGA